MGGRGRSKQQWRESFGLTVKNHVLLRELKLSPTIKKDTGKMGYFAAALSYLKRNELVNVRIREFYHPNIWGLTRTTRTGKSFENAIPFTKILINTRKMAKEHPLFNAVTLFHESIHARQSLLFRSEDRVGAENHARRLTREWLLKKLNSGRATRGEFDAIQRGLRKNAPFNPKKIKFGPKWKKPLKSKNIDIE